MNLSRNITIGLAFAAAVCMPSCVADSLSTDGCEPQLPPVVETGRYAINVVIRSVDDTGSRADDDTPLVDGDENEQKIGSGGNYMLFFDADNMFYAMSPLTLSPRTPFDPDIIEASYSSSVRPDSKGNFPAGVMVVLNASPVYDTLFAAQEEKSAEQVLEIDWKSLTAPETIGRTEQGLFTMSNSIYIDGAGKLQTVIPVTPDMIYDTTDPPKEEPPHLVIFVERMSAKFTLSVDAEPEADGTYIFDIDGDQMIFNGFDERTDLPLYEICKRRAVVTGWNVNALETSSYLFQKVDESVDYATHSPFEWVWKAPARYRTYWGEDPHYLGEYALQYRRSQDYPVNYYANMNNVLLNRSFKALGLGEPSFESTRKEYVPENTYNYARLKSSLDDRTDFLAGTHVLIGATLLIDEGDGYKSGTWYRDRKGMLYRNDKECYKAAINDYNRYLASQDTLHYRFVNFDGSNPDDQGRSLYAITDGEFYICLNGKRLEYADVDSFPDDFMAIATVKGGDGKRLPWAYDPTWKLTFVSDTQSTFKIYDVDNKELRTATDNDIKSLLFEWLGAFERFDNGRMYYAAPAIIKQAAPDSDIDDICGVVRNSWYHFNLKGINSVGTSVDDALQPIVPEFNDPFNQLNIHVEILPWHIIEIDVPFL